MPSFNRLHRSRSKGFTIVELLIVIVIIGILAAIVIVAYNGITSRAKDASLKADLSNVAKKLDVYKASSGVYPAQSVAELDAADFKVTNSNYVETRNNFYYCRSTDKLHYAIGIDATNNTEYYLVDGTPNLVPNGSVNSANTCTYLNDTAGFAATGGGSAGFVWDTATSTGAWQSWAQ